MRLYSLSDIISPSVQSKINYWSQLFLFLVSIVVLSGVIIDYGFELNENELKKSEQNAPIFLTKTYPHKKF